jgi:7-cyano-7-deazaguanine synthase in queuosine biosynthesis
MFTLTELKNNITPLLISDKKIGFLISGGLDSSILLYVSLMIMQEKNIEKSPMIFTVPRYDDSSRHSQNIINWMQKIFQKNLKIIIVGNPDLHHSVQLTSGIYESLKYVDTIFLGSTKNPDHLLNGPVRQKSKIDRIVKPFFYWTKKDTVALAIELGLTDLMTISHTCTESIEYRCKHCWQCQERRWAFTENNYVDPGEK